MYKKILSFAGFLTIALAPAAQAADGFYVGATGGVSFLQDADNEGGGLSIESEFDTGFDVTGAVGYRFMDDFRVEGEIGYRRNNADSLTIALPAGLGISSISSSADGDVSALSFMANGYYDVNTGTPWMPYVGAGLGVATINADVKTQGVQIVDDDDTVFAYQIGAGIGYAFTESITATAGYRFFGTSDPEFKATDGTSFDSEYSTHAVEIGFRVQF